MKAIISSCFCMVYFMFECNGTRCLPKNDMLKHQIIMKVLLPANASKIDIMSLSLRIRILKRIVLIYMYVH